MSVDLDTRIRARTVAEGDSVVITSGMYRWNDAPSQPHTAPSELDFAGTGRRRRAAVGDINNHGVGIGVTNEPNDPLPSAGRERDLTGASPDPFTDPSIWASSQNRQRAVAGITLSVSRKRPAELGGLLDRATELDVA